MKSLESYIVEELNIRNLTLTGDEQGFGVVYTLKPDFKVLGQKLKKDLGKVKAALDSVTQAQARLFTFENKLNVAGYDLLEDDLRVFIVFYTGCSNS